MALRETPLPFVDIDGQKAYRRLTEMTKGASAPFFHVKQFAQEVLARIQQTILCLSWQLLSEQWQRVL